MADRLNDTDPQSPVALQSRTDPGLGVGLPLPAPTLQPAVAPVVAPKASDAAVRADAAPPTPTPGSASIEALLDGITGPRPPASRREGARREGVEAGRVYSPARVVAPGHPTPPIEPAVFSPSPSSVSEREAQTGPRGASDPRSLRPVARRGEERTVYTGRRALVRNAVAVILSAAAVTAMMMGIMRWREGHSPRTALAPVVLSPLPASPESAPAQTLQIVSPPPPPPPAASDSSLALHASPSVSPIASTAPVAPLPKHVLTKRAKTPSPAAGSLDDLNRDISH